MSKSDDDRAILKEEIFQFLKKNLVIELSKSNTHAITGGFSVELILCGETISEDEL